MADGKKSFVLYCDIIHTVSHLDDVQAGKLFKHIVEYVNDKNPKTDDIVLKLAFEPIKQHLKRDLKKWDAYIEKQRLNGLKGGRPTKKEETQITQAFLENPSQAKKADSVIVSVSDIIKEPIIKMTGQDFIDFKEKMKSDTLFIEPLVMTKIKKDDLDKWINGFHIHIAGEDKLEKNYAEYKRHFKNWLNKQDTSTVPILLNGSVNGKSTPAYIKSEKETDFDKYRK